MTALAAALDALPKVELHCHIEGTLRPQTLVELAKANDVPLPTTDLAELYRYDSLDGFLDVFWLGQSTLVRREDWARLAYESLVDGAAHGVVHRESFFTPARHLAAGQAWPTSSPAWTERAAAAEQETGARCLLIADMDRAFGPKVGLDLVERLADLRAAGAPGSDRVIGVGMDSTELGIDPLTYRAAYDAARAAGFRLTAHQGENSGPPRSRPHSMSSGSSASTTACRCSTIPSWSDGWPASGSRSRSARPRTSSSPTPSSASRTTPTRRCATPDCWPPSTPTTRVHRPRPRSGVRRGRPRPSGGLARDAVDRARRSRGQLAR